VARAAFKLRAEVVERGFALILDRGGMRRAWLRGRENLHKRLCGRLLQDQGEFPGCASQSREINASHALMSMSAPTRRALVRTVSLMSVDASSAGQVLHLLRSGSLVSLGVGTSCQRY
jgi:hypothetical protein